MKRELQIVTAQPNDAASVLKIFNEARAEMAYLPAIHTSEETREYFTQLVAAGKISIVKENGLITGFMQAEDGWIHHLYISPFYQNKGLGKRLLYQAKALRPTGLKLWVFEENSQAIKFYEREGFLLVEKRNKEETTNEENLPDRKYEWKSK